MSIEVRTEAAEKMAEVLRGLKSGANINELLRETLNTPGYRFYLKFHASWKEPFSREDFEAMIRSLGKDSEKTHIKNWRLKIIAKAFREALTNLPKIRETVGLLNHVDLAKMGDMATAKLPPEVNLETTVYYLLDGFNSGTAFQGEVSFDVLRIHPEYLETLHLLTGAHELHHIGYGQVRERDRGWQKAREQSDERERLALDIVNELLSEGTATYFFKASDEEVARFYRTVFSPERADALMQNYRQMPERAPQKLNQVEELLLNLLVYRSRHIEDCREKWRSIAIGEPEMPYPWCHCVGAFVIETIGHAFGADKAIAMISDIESFLRTFNSAASKMGMNQRLDPRVVNAIEALLRAQ